MSANNPGVLYDATNSWNGYNHQGKIALWYAITEITKLYNPTISIGDDSDDDIALISSGILMNSNIYDLLMDYDCLISKNINIPSIMDKEILQGNSFDPRESEHIAHCKDVKVVSLDEFIKSL